MGQFVSRVHNKQDDKLYNILPMGDMPTVVFGRVIREHSVPGMQYYFSDGIVKFKKDGQDTMSKNGGWDGVIPFPVTFPVNTGRGYACIFTIPEKLDFAMMDDVEYVSQFCRSAKRLNANTMSPDFIIRNGVIICIRKIFIPSNDARKHGDYPNEDGKLGKVLFKITRKRCGSKKTKNNPNPRKYTQTNSKLVKHCINNEFSIVPFVKRGRDKKYKSIFEVDCFRYKDKNKWLWRVGRSRIKRVDG